MTSKLKKILVLVVTSLSSIVFAQTGAQANISDALSDYVLQPSDLIVVRVFQEENLTREVRVSQENTIMLPLIGTIVVGGKTVRQAEELIRELYEKDYLKNPQVNLLVTNHAQRTVNVIGAVNSPGPVLFPMEKGLTLMEAIARAGGLNRLGEKKDVRVTRINADGKTEVYVVNLEKIMTGRAQDNMQLQVNDIVFVREIIW